MSKKEKEKTHPITCVLSEQVKIKHKNEVKRWVTTNTKMDLKIRENSQHEVKPH